MDPEKGDDHLQPGGPAINAGAAEGAPADDLEDFPRPDGGGINLGCYEAHPEGAKPPALKSPPRGKTPNQAHDGSARTGP